MDALKKRLVVIYGNSLFLDGVEASLNRRAGFTLRKVDSTQPEALQTLMGLAPDVVIFDNRPEQGVGELRALLQARHSPLLIGLDLRSNQATILTSWRQQVRRADDLVNLILCPVQPSPCLLKGRTG